MNNRLNNGLFIEKFENAESSGKTLKELAVNSYVYLAYQNSVKVGNDIINFDELIDEEDAESVVTCCRENGIKEFTISSRSTKTIQSIMVLESQGCRLIGTAMIKLYSDRQPIPAFKMEVLN